jgi:hypothetical protein
MLRAARSLKYDSESEDELVFDPNPSSIHKAPKVKNDGELSGPTLAIRQTPLGKNYSARSSFSSSSSCSTTSSLFDINSKGAETPLTPPCSTDTKKSTAKDDGMASLFVQKCLVTKKSSPAPNTPVITSEMKKSSRSSTACQAREATPRVLDDDEISALTSGMSGLRLRDLRDQSSPSEQAEKKKRARQVEQGMDDYSNSSTRSSRLDRKVNARQISRTKEMVNPVDDAGDSVSVWKSIIAKPKDVRTPRRGRDTASFKPRVKEKHSEHPIVKIENEDGEFVEDSSGSLAQHLSVSDDPRGLRDIRSTPQPNHGRSKSTSSVQEKTPIRPQASSSKSSTESSAKLEKAPGTLSLLAASEDKSRRRISNGTGTPSSTSTRGRLRRRSTGSLETSESLSQSTEAINSGNQGPNHGASRAGAAPPSRTGKRNASRANPKTEQKTGPHVAATFPRLNDYNPLKNNQNEMKLEILEAIRRKSASKSPRIRTITSLLDRIWKEWSDPAGRPSKIASSEDDGYIYIFRSKPDAFPGRNYVKIGKTRQRPQERRKQWEKGCKFECIHIQDDNDKRFLHYGKAESIIHAELYNERRKFECPKCHKGHDLELGEKSTRKTATEHGEWFEISEEKALEVVNKWRDWIIQKDPYRPDGTLRASWMWKCRVVSICMKGTEADWIGWRKFSWPETISCLWHHISVWLGKILPPAFKILMARGAIFGPAMIWYFWALGVNVGSCFIFLAALLVLAYIFLK